MRVGVVGLLVWCSGHAYAQEATSPWTDAVPQESTPAPSPPVDAAPSEPAPTDAAAPEQAAPVDVASPVAPEVPASSPAAPASKAGGKAKKRKPDGDDAAAVSNAPAEAAPVETAPVEAAPVEAAPVEAAPVEAAPAEVAPVEAVTAEAVTAEAAPVEAAPVEAVGVEAAPVEAAPVEVAPVEAVVVEAAPVEAASAPVPVPVPVEVASAKATAKGKKRKSTSDEAAAAVAALLDAQEADGAALDAAALEGAAEAIDTLTVVLGGTPTGATVEAESAAALPEEMLEQAAAALPTLVEALGGAAPATDADVVEPEGAAAVATETDPPSAPVAAPADPTPPTGAPVPEPVAVRAVAAPVVLTPAPSTGTVVASTPAPDAVRPVKVQGPPPSPETPPEPAASPAAPEVGAAVATASSNVLRLGATEAYEVQTLGGAPEEVALKPADVADAERPVVAPALADEGLKPAPRDLKRRIPELPVAYEAILGTKRIVCAAEVRLDGAGRADRVGVTTCPAAMKLAVADALTDWRWPEGAAGWFAVEVPVARSVRGASGRLYHPGFTELSPDRPATGGRELPVLVKSGKMPIYPRQVYHGDATCLVSATILRTGKSADLRIDDCTTPYRVELNKVVKGWRWYPAEVDGVPTSANIEFEVSFRLEQAAR